MITRLYIDNFKSFVNFELRVGLIMSRCILSESEFSEF
jgi:hypothetical protein